MKNNLFAYRRGFTLIELLVVIAIIGLLGTIISGPINNARKKAKDAKKIADFRVIKTALTQYKDENGQYPATLATLVPRYLDSAPVNFSTTTPAVDRYMYVLYRDGSGVNVGYHLGVKLEVGNPALQTDADCRGTSCNPATGSVSYTNYVAGAVGNPAATAASAASNSANVAADFNGSGANEAAGNACTSALTSCVYDIVGSL